MSMDDAPLGGVADAGPDLSGGDTGAEANAPEGAPEQPARQYVEVDDPDNRYERVKVNGEDVEVPYSELKRGYSREADYTRKSQEVAEARKQAEFGLQLQQALQADPETTLRILAQNYGLTLAQAQQAVEAAAPTFDDPLEEQIYNERQARLALEDRLAQREADMQLETAINGLRSEFNLGDEDVRAVVFTASKMNVGVEAFPQIWKAMAYDRIAARVRAQQDSKAAEQATQQQRQQAAAQASALVGNGTGSGNGLTNQVDPSNRHMSIREAIQLSLEQHGV